MPAEQLALDFDAAPPVADLTPADLAWYDRQPVGQNLALNAHELRALAHGSAYGSYQLLAAHDEPGLGWGYTFNALGDVRTAEADWWRCELDVLYLLAKRGSE